MYVFFEHHKDSSGAVLATDVVASSYQDRVGIQWKKDEVPMKLLTELFKTPRLEQRNYDKILHIWTYLGDAGKHLLEVVQDSFEKLHINVQFFETEDLEAQVKAGRFNDARAKAFDPKNFFYNRAVPNATPAITREVAVKQLSVIFGVSMDGLSKENAKKFYRQQALLLHPDRNGGDGSKMSELNMLWSVYNAS